MILNIKNLDSTFLKLDEQLEKQRKIILARESKVILNELVSGTPIDTGNAREGWNLKQKGKGFEISNEVPYIESLNNGHSKQAPSHYVERIALQHGRPVGSIITVSN